MIFLFYSAILEYPDIDPPPYPTPAAGEKQSKELAIVNPAPAYSAENHPNSNCN